MEHLLNFDENLAELLRSQPTQVLNSLEQAIGTVYKNHYTEDTFGLESTPSFQLQVSSNENPRMLRDLQSNLMGQLVVVPGIITAASKTHIKSTSTVIKCGNCGHEKTLIMKNGFGGTQLPRQCD